MFSLLLLLLIDLQLPGAYRFVAVPDGLHVHFGTPESTRPPTSPVPGPLHFSGPSFLMCLVWRVPLPLVAGQLLPLVGLDLRLSCWDYGSNADRACVLVFHLTCVLDDDPATLRAGYRTGTNL